MKRSTVLLISAILFAVVSYAQTQPAEPVNPHKAALDRLQSLTIESETEWRFHADLPHPEDPSLSDSSWEAMKVGDRWSDGPRVLRRWIVIPEKINGYSTQ